MKTGIDRGKVKEKTEEGYRVESYSDEGLITPPLRAMPGQTFSVGDMVYFFMYDDGTGAVVCKF